MNTICKLVNQLTGNSSDTAGLDIQLLLTQIKEHNANHKNESEELNQFIRQFANAANLTPLYEAADAGTQAGIRLRDTCRNILGNAISPYDQDYNMKITPVREKLEQFSDMQTRYCLCYLLIADMYYADAQNAYRVELQKKITEFTDYLRIIKLQDAVESGDSKDVALSLYNRLIFVAPMQAFKQGFINDMIHAMLYVDKDSQTPVFQLYLEHF